MGGYIDHPDLPFSEPGTSKDAAESMVGSVGYLQSLVLAHLKKCGDHGATDEEGAAAIGLTLRSYGPRRNELVYKERVMNLGVKRPGRSGRNQTVWGIREAE